MNDNIDTNDQVKPMPAPSFYEEPFYVGAVLDYVLVDWTTSLYNMIRTRDGRKLLRKYTENALMVVSCALNVFHNHDHFRYLLRVLWDRRAQLYFDGHDTQIPYIRHIFTMDHMSPHTYDTQKLLFPLNSLTSQNSLVTDLCVNTILNIHVADLPGHEEHDIYSAYQRNGMSRAEYYLESHIDQFYRTLFFFIELQMSGITSHEEDTYDGSLPDDILPIFIQSIVYNDDSYRDYLLQKRRQLEENRAYAEIGQTSRVQEEDLIFIMKSLVISKSSSPTTASSTTASPATTSSTTSTTSQSSKRKGSVCVNANGKHFLKKSRTTFLESCCDKYHEKSDNTQNQNKNTELCLRQRYNYIVKNFEDNAFVVCSMVSASNRQNQNENYGFIVDNSDFDHFEYLNEQSSGIVEILRSILIPSNSLI